MPRAAIDACCLIDLLVSGHAEAILRASGFAWFLPTAVQKEVRYIRQHDPATPGTHIDTPVDLAAFVASNLLQVCAPEPSELERFVYYAAQFRSDGEAMCIALAEHRGWVVATDDRKAIRIAQEAGLRVVSCPELMRSWATSARPDPDTLQSALRNIQVLARFSPRPTMPDYAWWQDQVAGWTG